MKCEKCERQLIAVEINEFQRDGSDRFRDIPIKEYLDNAVGFETTQDWCGYDLTEEEQAETILCPYCNEFPFKDREIQVYEVVRVACFKQK